MTDQNLRSSLIGGKAEAGLNAILAASNLSPAEALKVAHEQTKNLNASYSTVMVADIVMDQKNRGLLRFAGLGDPAVVAYRQDKPFEHRRSELSGAFVDAKTPVPERERILGEPSHMQIQNEQHNNAVLAKLHPYDASMRQTPTMALDSTGGAAGIYHTFGESKKTIYPKEFEVDLEQLDADFLLIMTDGAQPNSVLAANQRVDISQDIADAEAVDNTNGVLTMRNQPLYAQEVQLIMEELTAGKIDITIASNRIALAARNTLGDSDDISVVIVDVRQFRKKNKKN